MMMRPSLFRPMVFCRSFATPAIRDPARPVLPLTAYFRFADAFRKEKSLKGGVETMKIIGAEWRKLPVEKRAPFESACRVDREKYTAAFQKYKDSGALDAWKRDPHRPKRPQTGFLRYLETFRKSDKAKGLKVTEVMRAAGKSWRAEDPVKKKALNDAYQREKVGYDKAFADYKASGKEIAWKKKVGIWDVEQKALKKKEEAKEKKRKLAEKARLAKERIKNREKERKLKMKERDRRLREKEKIKRANERKKAKTSKSGSLSTRSAKPGNLQKERMKLLGDIEKEKKQLDMLTLKLMRREVSEKKKAVASRTTSSSKGSKSTVVKTKAASAKTKSSARI